MKQRWRSTAVIRTKPVDYPALLVERVGEAVERAAKSVRAVRIESGTTRLPGIAFNRRYHMRDGTVQFNPGKKNPNIVGPAGPVDEELPIVLFRDAQTDKPMASLTVFAMHVATFGDGKSFGADFPGCPASQAAGAIRTRVHLRIRRRHGRRCEPRRRDLGGGPGRYERSTVRIGTKMAETWFAAMPVLDSRSLRRGWLHVPRACPSR